MHRLRKASGFIKKSSLLCTTLFCHFLTNSIFAAPLALLGGQGNAPYAAFLQSDGSVAKLKGLPLTGLTYRVASNSHGEGIIGGTSGVNAYAARVSPAGHLHPIAGLMAPGEIYTVAINEAGEGIIGGGHLKTNQPYAALVAKSGSATSLSLPPRGLIYSVALDPSGEGIIGGIGPSKSAYASIVSSKGAMAPLADLPKKGAIFWVATNESKTRFIGGQDNASVYAAFVTPNGSVKAISGLPQGLNYSVALNASGNAIMGGTSVTAPYAALIAKNGSVKTLRGLPTTAGTIYNVTINESGAGLIAGFSTKGPYGSLVAPNGSLTPLKDLPTDGFLDGVALHSSGIGIVGGTTDDVPFAALVAPNGKLTYLRGLPSNGQINSISLATLDQLIPKYIGPLDSWANTQFALSNHLTQHCLFQNRQKFCCDECLAAECDEEKSTLWFSTFGNYVHEKGQDCLPTFSNKIAGALLGFDYEICQDFSIGAGLAYAYNSVHYSHNNASINQESAVVYAIWDNSYFYMNAALWGGISQTTNKRRSLACITSTAKPSGWNLSPHFDIGAPFATRLPMALIIEPFVTFDWANNWQSHFHERGSSGFNVHLNKQHASIFRSEVGLRFFETAQFEWGCLIFEEKVSYVNRAFHHKGKSVASFIGSVSSFNVETSNHKAKDQGIIELHMECIPTYLKSVYASFDYQGAFGSSFQSHMLTLTIEKNF
jgi:hypothetical protein